MRVAMLGGTSFIGPAVVEELLRAGHDVAVVHRGSREPGDLPDVTHRHLDRYDEARLRDTLRDLKPDVLVDTCAYDRRAAEIAARALPRGARAVVLSSCDVYRAFGHILAGRHGEPIPLTESSPLRDERYPYRRMPAVKALRGIDPANYDKLDVEEGYRPARPAVLRLPIVYGERDGLRREEFVLRRVRAGRAQIPFGPGNFLWTRAWVRDVARAVRLTAESPDTLDVTLNLGEPETWTIRQWAEQILEAAGAEAELVDVPDRALPEDLQITGTFQQHLVIDAGRARELLGWRPSDPAAAVRASVRWHLDHPPAGASEDFSEDDFALTGR